jgi:crossover junction endodeoxyribonuclease RuvC
MIIMGYSIIQIRSNVVTVKEIDVLKLPAKKDNYFRLQLIHARVKELVEAYTPTDFAIEAPFFGKNVQSMLKLGRAQGVAIAAAMGHSIPVFEYSPKKVKQSITGNGNADKDQVWDMVQRITVVPDKPKYFDATDALAVALCHHFMVQKPYAAKTSAAKRNSKGGWDAFIQQNPERVL